MELRHLEFQFELRPGDTKRIIAAINRWKEDKDLANQFSGAFLYRKFEAWFQFVETDWSDWDISEYSHDIGCRYWLQIAIENGTAGTAHTLQQCAGPADMLFQSRMHPKKDVRLFRMVAFQRQPYFWETHTIHPEE